jgi:hypothetical protein
MACRPGTTSRPSPPTMRPTSSALKNPLAVMRQL